MSKKPTAPAGTQAARRPPRPAAHAEDALLQLVLSLGAGVEPALVLDGEGHVLHAAARGRDLGLAGAPVSSLLAEGDDERVLAAVRHAAHPGIPQTVDATVRLGGRNRRMRLRLLPHRVAGRVAAVLVTCTDVDGLHRELQSLRRAERLMRDTQGMSHVGTWYWDIIQPHAEWSEQLYRIYGLDPNEHAPTYEDYLTRVHPDDVERVKTATEAVFQNHQPYSHDERIRHTDGSWRHLHTWAEAVLDDDGALVALQGVCMDISDRKEAELALVDTEARQRSILEHAGLGIATLGPDGTLEDANPAFQRLLGDGGDQLGDLLDEDSRGEASALLDGLFGGADHLVETTVHAGSGRWARLILSLVAEDRDAPFVVALAQDVSAEHAAREAQDRVAALEEAGRRRDTMLGVASHEIKNPLTPIRAELALLRTDIPDDRRTKLIDRIDEQVQRVSGVVRDLLDTVRAGEAGIPLRRVRTDLAEVTRRAVDDLRDQARSWDVTLRLEARPSWVEGDPTRLRQVVDNLVRNALRHAPGHTEVAVRVAAGRVEVLDRGAGVPDEVRNALFEPYAASDAHAAREGGSTGLGLYLCREIVHAHGGRIGLEDRDGGGTRAWFAVPGEDAPTGGAA